MPAIGAERAQDVTPTRSLDAKLNALADAPARNSRTAIDERVEEVLDQTFAGPIEAAEPEPEGSQDAGSESEGLVSEAAKANPAKIALIERLRRSAAKGTDSLRRTIATSSETNLAMLRDADHEALGGAADAVDQSPKRR